MKQVEELIRQLVGLIELVDIRSNWNRTKEIHDSTIGRINVLVVSTKIK